MNQLNARREFLKNTLTAAAATAILPNFAFKDDEKPLGLQLWSVRDALEEDFEDTIKSIAKAGFGYVEGFGYDKGKWFGKDFKEMRTILKDWELKMPSAHVVFKSSHFDTKTKTVTDEWKKVVEDSLKVGQRYLISPWTDEKDRADLDTYKRFVEMLNKAGEYAKTLNLKFGYHNHWFEFDKLGGETMYDLLLKGTDPQFVTMELDVCWATYAKQDPVALFTKYPGRFELLHMKDLIEDATSHEEATTIIGKGVVDFEAILQNARKGGVRHYIVELEDYEKTSVDDVKVCYKNLRKMMK